MNLNKLNDYEFKETLKGQYDKIVEEINELGGE